jgi:glycerol-3-phosphate acyltransferase PlsY
MGLLPSYLACAVVAMLANFFPKHLGEEMSTPVNTKDLIILGVSLILLLLAILSEAFAYRKWFRLYSLVTLLAFLVLTILGLFQTMPHVGAQECTITYGCLP